MCQICTVPLIWVLRLRSAVIALPELTHPLAKRPRKSCARHGAITHTISPVRLASEATEDYTSIVYLVEGHQMQKMKNL